MISRPDYGYDQGRLLTLQRMLCGQADDLFAALGVSVRKLGRTYVGPCPVHGGDNPNALNLYRDGDSVPGYWRCWTHHCESIFKRTILGFVRGVLSRERFGWSLTKRNATVTWQDTVDWCCALLGVQMGDIEEDRNGTEKRSFAFAVSVLNGNGGSRDKVGIDRPKVRNGLKIPANYFVTRGWSREVLDKYDVGLCTTPGRPMYSRAVVPVYDEDYKVMVGCTGRSVHEKCAKCNLYHPGSQCPINHGGKGNPYTKWRNSSSFRREFHLYNYWFARKHIRQSGVVCLCEGPGDVWRLEEAGIHVGVAMFGTELADPQQVLLEKSGATNVIVLTDTDKPGREAAGRLGKQLGRCFRVHTPDFPAHDLGCMSPADVRTRLLPILQNASRGWYV